MTNGEPVQRVRIYLNERDLREGQALYVLVLERLRREGATGATALRGIAGFGPGQRARPGSGALSSQPVVVEWVDRAERVARTLPALDDLVGEALVTVEDLRAYRARLRSGGTFGTRPVGELIGAAPLAAPPEAGVRDAVRALVEGGHVALAVVDAERHLLGLLSEQDLMRRAGLALPLAVCRALRPEEREDVLRALQDRPLENLLVEEPRTSHVMASLQNAVGTMIEWGLDALPVVDRDGTFAGLLTVEDALRSAASAERQREGAVRDSEAPPPVRLLMQTSVPTAAAASDGLAALRQVLAAPEQFLVVLEEGRPVGTLDSASALARLESPLRYEWLAALRSGAAPALTPPDPPPTALDLAHAPALTVGELTPEDEAVRAMLAQRAERLVVVDAEGALAGVIGRRAMLRALFQEGSS